MSKIQLHAIKGTMILEKQGIDKLLSIRSQFKEETTIFVIAPVCNGELELQSLLEAARNQDERVWPLMENRTSAWTAVVESLITGNKQVELLQRIKHGFTTIDEILRAIWLVGDISNGTKNHVASEVAYWAALFFKEALELNNFKSRLVNVKEVLDSVEFKANPGETILVIGELPQSETSLGDCNSEYCSSLIGGKLKVSGITFWNENELVTTADLKEVPSATVIECLTFAEATELSFFGSSIIHPQNMVPLMANKIPLYLRSFSDHTHPGTLIDDDKGRNNGKAVKGFSVIKNVSLINVEGAGMIGVPGIAQRLFAAMHDSDISVILISQASSEYSICFAVPSEQAALAKAIARTTFTNELDNHRIHKIEAELGCAILAAVGENMIGVPGISGSFFSALGKARVNVRAIAQGSSERNISAVIKQEDARRALRALHAGFFLSNQALSVGLFGPGNIGSTFLDQIANEASRLNNEFGVDIRIRAIANSKKMLLDGNGIDLATWRERFKNEAVELDVKTMVKHVSASYFPHAVLIDCTSSASLPEHYHGWIERGIHVITPNKKAGTAPYSKYSKLMEVGRHNKKHFLYETTVGAGLPVIGTLKDLIQTGDRIHSVEGIVSGTLAYLFSSYDGSVPFSILVKGAKEKGYTEPDPRDDLSGMDVARKTVILARELGYKVELEEIEITSLVPQELKEVTQGEFMERMNLMDEPIEKLFRAAENEGKSLRYVGRVEKDGSCHVELAAYPKNHPFAQSKGTDNVVAFTTERYNKQPLVIQGPGAGPEVTAAGVFADLLRLSSYLGARL